MLAITQNRPERKGYWLLGCPPLTYGLGLRAFALAQHAKTELRFVTLRVRRRTLYEYVAG